MRSLKQEETDQPDEILNDTKMTEELLSIAADKLRSRGWVTVQPDECLAGFRYIKPTIFQPSLERMGSSAGCHDCGEDRN